VRQRRDSREGRRDRNIDDVPKIGTMCGSGWEGTAITDIY
jgi:hypothetical protein